VAQVDTARRFVRWENPADIPIADSEPVLAESLQYSLSVFLDGRFEGAAENLSLHEANPRFISTIFSNPWSEFSTQQSPNAGNIPPLIRVERHRRLDPLDLTMPSVTLPLTDGADGLLDVQIEDFCGTSSDGSIDSAENTIRGIDGLSPIREISIVAIPDLYCQPVMENPTVAPPPSPPPRDICCCQSAAPVDHPEPPLPPRPTRPRIRGFSSQEVSLAQQRLLDHCQRSGRRFAILAPPKDIGQAQSGSLHEVLDWRSQFDTSFGALYFPWIRVSDPVRGGSRLVPPCGFIAGMAARTDQSVGVHRSPANLELLGAVGVAREFGDAHHTILNPAGVNLIRPYMGRGIRVVGARTLTREAPYQFVAVRRLLIMLRSALELATQWAVFEPAHELTRARLKLSVESFLDAVWRRGMLAGNVPSQAFRIAFDNGDDPQRMQDNGMLLMNIELAPAIPGEFIMLRIGRIDSEQPVGWE
jgi:hypothetical protein